MDRLDQMRLFVRVVERGSFSAAAADLHVARSGATQGIKQLEKALGVRLLDRTTRHLVMTLDGEAYLQRCQSILHNVDEAEGLFRNAEPQGVLRVDAHGLLTRTFLLPRLGEFLDRYPLLDLQLGQGDRLVDLIREGVDCVIRAGVSTDSGLIMRKLGYIEEITCASPVYLRKFGTPTGLEDLDNHAMIGFISSRNGQVMPLEFNVEGQIRQVALRSRITVNNSDTAADLARQGFGLIQAPRYRLRNDLANGALVEVLSAFPPAPIPLSALYPQNRHTSPRVRVFLDWVSDIFSSAKI